MNSANNSKAGKIKFSLFLFTAAIIYNTSLAQNVGIGTLNPSRKFSVAGSIAVDHGNSNMGTLDSASLVFGTGGVGINSRKVGGQVNGLHFWTSNLQRVHIANNGNIGIGGDAVTIYKLRIYDGDVTIDSSLYVQKNFSAYSNSAIGGAVDLSAKFRVYGSTKLNTLQTSGNVTIGSDLDNDYRLRVVGGDTRFGGDMHATGNVAFGALPNSNYRLLVNDGSSYFDGQVHVNGNIGVGNIGASGVITANHIDVVQTMSIQGTGSVRSNGPSPLRVGFDQKTVDYNIPANGAVTVEADITDFSGDNDDVRVMVSQIKLNAGNTMFTSEININVIEVDAAANTCTMRIRNLGNAAATLKATIYLTTIAKN